MANPVAVVQQLLALLKWLTDAGVPLDEAYALLVMFLHLVSSGFMLP